jgi:hypothetical protein
VRKPKVRVPLSVEAVECRKAPTSLVPVLTTGVLNAVAADVHRVMGALARDHNVARAGARLDALASRVPFGQRDLAPLWRADLASVNPGVPGSGLAAQARMVRDLYQDVVQEVQAGAFRVVGRGSQVFNAHAPGVGAQSVASVNLANRTGFSITVTAFLNSGNPRPSITRTIPNNTTALFDFGTGNNAYISLNVMRTNNPQSPPPLVNYTLTRPVSGYNGATFTVSVFAGYFSIGF